MSKLPVLKPQEEIRLLEAIGFVEVQQRGSHKQFRHADGRRTTVPFHKGRDIAPGLLRQIIRDIGMSFDEFFGGEKSELLKSLLWPGLPTGSLLRP
jgi:predicted RNA binding protein YcfA (HicA-like mRNA interferase family)